jgi:hypothetical protein
MILVRRFWSLCWGGRIQAEHVVSEITEFYYRNKGRDYRCGLCWWNGGAACRKKKRRTFILGYFYIILNLEGGEKTSCLQ